MSGSEEQHEAGIEASQDTAREQPVPKKNAFAMLLSSSRKTPAAAQKPVSPG